MVEKTKEKLTRFYKKYENLINGLWKLIGL